MTTMTLDRAGGSWLSALRFALVGMLLFGLLLPLTMTVLNQLLFPAQATGSLLLRDGQVVGSALVGQPFVGPGWFYGRPSAAGWDPRAAAGSNWAPSNPALRERMAADAAAIAAREAVAPTAIPVELISASGSGLDPHISPDAARLQIARVARERNLPTATLQALVDAHTAHPWLGPPVVNVLELNLALDEGTKELESKSDALPRPFGS
ncbi:MAG: potassium-transporting ATPase subunit KdpC [Lysobacterales bacterium]